MKKIIFFCMILSNGLALASSPIENQKIITCEGVGQYLPRSSRVPIAAHIDVSNDRRPKIVLKFSDWQSPWKSIRGISIPNFSEYYPEKLKWVEFRKNPYGGGYNYEVIFDGSYGNGYTFMLFMDPKDLQLKAVMGNNDDIGGEAFYTKLACHTDLPPPDVDYQP